MNREAVLEAIRTAAARNGGRPPGAKAFHSSSGVSRTDLWNAGFPRYSDAVTAAGLEPNQLQGALDSSRMLSSLAALVRSLGRFPSISDLKAARAMNPDIPSYEAFFRLSGGAYRRLASILIEYCRKDPELADVHGLLQPQNQVDELQTTTSTTPPRITGYVYLAKHGRDYKIGRSNDVTRRRREVALLLPQELEHVHVIETDDPEGIEQYWHRRFESRRLRGEWYRLSPEDVASFRRRRYQ